MSVFKMYDYLKEVLESTHHVNGLAAWKRVLRFEKYHVDKGNEYTGCTTLRTCCLSRIICCLVYPPFDNHQKRQITKHSTEKDDLRNKLCNDAYFVVEVLVISQGQEDSKQHMQDSKNDRNFHLEGVQENNLIFRYLKYKLCLMTRI